MHIQARMYTNTYTQVHTQNTNMHTHTKMHVNINLYMHSLNTKCMKIYEYSKTHAFICSQTCTGTYTLHNCANAPKKYMRTGTYIHAHSFTNAQLHIHVQICSFTHPFTQSLSRPFTHSLTHLLTYFNSF